MNSIEKQTLIGGRYGLRDPLGSGGMAEVFLAHDEVLKRDVALKILKEKYAVDEDFVERFRREARSAASLNHPHIVHIYDWGPSGDGRGYYMAMEYVPGGTLKDRILRDGALPPRMAVGIACQIAQGLEAAHGRGMVHRDVKPQNVLLAPSGEAKVADFGIARAANVTTTSGPGLILGTAGYMSPEQAKGEPTGPRSDLYSLGVVLFEMLTGEMPYEANTPAVVGAKHVTEPARSPKEVNPTVPDEIDALTLRLLAKDPVDRYESAAQLVEDFRRAWDELSPVVADDEPAAVERTLVSASPVFAKKDEDGASDGPYVVYGRRFEALERLPLTLGMALVALLVLLGVAAWGPWSGSQELAQAKDVAGGSLGESDEPFDGDERLDGSKEEAPDIGNLSEAKGWVSPARADIGNPRLVGFNVPSSAAVPRQGSVEQAPRAGVPVESGTEVIDTATNSGSELVNVPEVSGESTEEASRALSNAGHEAGKTTVRNSEPAGTVIGTDPVEGAAVKRGTAVSLLVSSGPTSRDNSNDGEDVASVSVKEKTSTSTQQKSKKRDKKPPR